MSLKYWSTFYFFHHFKEPNEKTFRNRQAWLWSMIHSGPIEDISAIAMHLPKWPRRYVDYEWMNGCSKEDENGTNIQTTDWRSESSRIFDFWLLTWIMKRSQKKDLGYSRYIEMTKDSWKNVPFSYMSYIHSIQRSLLTCFNGLFNLLGWLEESKDPVNKFATFHAHFELRRVVERKHKGVAIAAVVGMLFHNADIEFPEYHFSDIPNGRNGPFSVPLAGISQIVLHLNKYRWR